MKTIKKLFLILCLLTLSSIIPVSAAKAGSKKSPAGKSYISISNIKLSSSKLKAGDTLKYSFKITDKDVAAHFRRGGMPKTIAYLQLTWTSSKNQSITRLYKWDGNKESKHKSTLRISDKIKVKNGMQSGKWKLARLDFYSIGGEDCDSLMIYNSKMTKQTKQTPVINLSAFNFTVRKTGAADNEAPIADLNSMKLNKDIAAFSQKVKFSLKVSDSSAIKEVICRWQSFEKDGDIFDQEDSLPMKYNKSTKRYECKIRGCAQTDYKVLTEIVVYDIYNNQRVYSFHKNNGPVVRIYGSSDIKQYMEAQPQK